MMLRGAMDWMRSLNPTRMSPRDFQPNRTDLVWFCRDWLDWGWTHGRPDEVGRRPCVARVSGATPTLGWRLGMRCVGLCPIQSARVGSYQRSLWWRAMRRATGGGVASDRRWIRDVLTDSSHNIKLCNRHRVNMFEGCSRFAKLRAGSLE